MTALPLSVIIVSRHRPQALARCITALRQQDHPNLEVIVVADPGGQAVLHGQDDLKLIAFDTPNISAARNLGLAAAAGEVALFIDDDAVPAPNWASRLSAPFANRAVVAATGFVRGRNGISFQWRAAMVDHLGQDHPLNVPNTPSLHRGCAQMAVKTQGTNCAFRLSTLRQIGGFDSAFAFFLDEADVNLRLAGHGPTAVVPLAQVQHGYMASARRKENRAPTSLHDMAASTAIFLRKHAPLADLSAMRGQLETAQRQRLAKFRARRLIRRADIPHLLADLDIGWQTGLRARFGQTPPLPQGTDFRPLSGIGPRRALVLSGPSWRAPQLHAQAATALAQGKIVIVYCLSYGLRRHRLQFLPQGYWWQSGGIWGRANRDHAAPLCWGLAKRVQIEAAALADFCPAEGEFVPNS